MSKPSTPNEQIEILFRSIIGPIGATGVAHLMHEPEHIEERVTVLVNTFNEFPDLKEPFRLLVKSLRSQEVEISLEEQIRLYTTKHTRFWLLANMVNKILRTKDLALDYKTGRMPSKPNELLKFAYQAQESLGAEGRYKDIAFACGFLYDFVFHVQRSPLLDLGKNRYDDLIATNFTRSLDQAKKVVLLNKYKSKLSLEKLGPATPFLRNLGQIILTFLNQNSAVEFYKRLEMAKPSEPIRLALEARLFGIHTAMIASYLAEVFPLFENLGEIMSVWGFPFLSFVHGKKDVHDLAGMGLIGVMITEKYKAVDFGLLGKPSLPMPELLHLDFVLTPEAKNDLKI